MAQCVSLRSTYCALRLLLRLLRDHPIERVLRDVRVHQILEGTNEVMRLIVSREILGN
jgi:alkylation response protein AidB-like acyl-CoA dehydrogenase